MKYTGIFRILIMALLIMAPASGTCLAAVVDLTANGGFSAEGTVTYDSEYSATLYEDEGMGYTVLYNDPYYGDTGITAAGSQLSFDIAIFTTGVDSFEINLLTADDQISLYYYESDGSGKVDFQNSFSFILGDYGIDDIFGLEFVLTSVSCGFITDTADAQFTVSNVQTVNPVPSPSAIILLGAGLICLTRRQRRLAV